MSRKGIKIVVVTHAGVIALAILALPYVDHVNSFVVRVQGRLVLQDGRDSAADARVWTIPSWRPADAQDNEEVWAERSGALTFASSGTTDEAGRAVDGFPGYAGALTGSEGTFTFCIHLLQSHGESLLFTYGDRHPPPRHGIRALRIEIEGRDPVILDVPEGTWTEHEGEDGLWATWELGVVEVPGRP